ncbi:MAG: AgmX/PglI C-terminal domain-containing protein [Myxococcota bacterium]
MVSAIPPAGSIGCTAPPPPPTRCTTVSREVQVRAVEPSAQSVDSRPRVDCYGGHVVGDKPPTLVGGVTHTGGRFRKVFLREWEVRDASGTPACVSMRVIRNHRRELTTCYEHELAVGPATGGPVTVAIQLDDDGHVASAEADTPGRRLSACFEEAARRWRFPRPRDLYPRALTLSFVLDAEDLPEPRPHRASDQP